MKTMVKSSFIYKNIFFSLLILLMSCSDESNTPEIPDKYQNAIINPDYVPIQWENATISLCDTLTGQIVFTTTEKPAIETGSVISVNLADTATHVFIVNKITLKDNTYTLETERGTLANIFSNTSFILDTSGNSDIVSSQSNVFRPVKSIYVDENGKKVVVDEFPTRGETSFTKDIWEDTIFETEKLILAEADNWCFYVKNADFRMDVDLEMKMNFGEPTLWKTINEGLNLYRSGNLEVEAYLKGTAEANSEVRLEGWGGGSYEKGYELVKHDLFKPIGKLFMVYNIVPVYLELNADLYKEANAHVDFYGSVSTGFNNTSIGKIGMSWKQNGNQIKPIAEFENVTDPIFPTLNGYGRIEGKIGIFPRVRVTIYNSIGLSFDIKPYLKTVVQGGFGQEMIQDNTDFIALELDNYIGIESAIGFSKMYYNYEVLNKPIIAGEVYEKCIYHSPDSMAELSHNDVIAIGESVNFRHGVYDINKLNRTKNLTPLPQIIKYLYSNVNTGTEKQEYKTTKNGIVDFTWTPEDKNDILTVSLYRTNGEIVDEFKYLVKDSREVDLGLSVKWANCNLGATSPEDYGDYFAWGDVNPWTEKYENDENYTYPNTLNLSSNKDAATKMWGGTWRMPTKAECVELLNKCSWKLENRGNIKGYKVTGENGNSIFLPLTGSANNDEGKNYEARYRTSQAEYCDSDYTPSTIVLELQKNLSEVGMDHASGYVGHPIRPVCK